MLEWTIDERNHTIKGQQGENNMRNMKAAKTMKAIGRSITIVALLSIVMIMLAFSASALKQLAGPLEIDSCPGKQGHALYGLMADSNHAENVTLRAEGNISSYITIPKMFIIQPNGINYVVVFDSINENTTYGKRSIFGKTINGFLFATQSVTPCEGCANINIEMKKQVTMKVCRGPFSISRSFKELFTFIDFSRIFGSNGNKKAENATEINKTAKKEENNKMENKTKSMLTSSSEVKSNQTLKTGGEK
jgi:hypothetical protein